MYKDQIKNCNKMMKMLIIYIEFNNNNVFNTNLMLLILFLSLKGGR